MTKLTSREIDELIERTIAGDKPARECVFGEVQRFVLGLKLRPLGPYSRDPDCIAEVCGRVVARLLVNDCKRLREYLLRPNRCFWSWLQVVTTRVAIDLARGMRQNIASRSETTFRWVKEVELFEPDQTESPDPLSRLHLLDIYRYLHTCADPTDVEMLQQSVQSSRSWQEIARLHNLKPHTARQRVRRLRQSLRQWVQGDDC